MTILTVFGVHLYRFDYSPNSKGAVPTAPDNRVSTRAVVNGLWASAAPLYQKPTGRKYPVVIRVFNSSGKHFRANAESSELVLEFKQGEAASRTVLANWQVSPGVLPESIPARTPGVPEPFVQFTVDAMPALSKLPAGAYELRFSLALESEKGVSFVLTMAPVSFVVSPGGADGRSEGK